MKNIKKLCKVAMIFDKEKRIMKKFYLSVLIAVLWCSLTGCSDENNMLSSEENSQIAEESNIAGKSEDVNIEESIDSEEKDETINSNQSTEMNQPSSQAVHSGTIEVCNYGSDEGSNACDISDIDELYNLLNELNYKTETSDGLPEYKVTFDGNEIFYINLTDKRVWKDKKEASLSDSELTLIMSCIDS